MTQLSTQDAAPTQTITLGGGCFWCTEAVYVRVRGVLDVESGYCNGQTVRPTYEQICTGRTGHAEVVKLVFDPKQISLSAILDIFFVIHDPTTLNAQGNDRGTQYRSGIFTQGPEQHATALAYLTDLKASAAFDEAVVTEITLLANYSAAEDYHQDYFENNPNQGYCSFVVAPKVQKLRQTFKEYLKN